MHRVRLFLVVTLVLAVFGLNLTAAGAAPSAAPHIILAVTSANDLIAFSSADPSTILRTIAITGLQGGETIEGIDFRPSTGDLYALGSTSRLYILNPATGVATQVGTGPFSPALSGTEFGFDFNPTVDRIRVTSDADQNLRLNPNTGTVAATDTNLNPADPTIAASAYTNSVFGATTTTLYNIDSGTDTLYIQTPPNNGTLVLVGALGVSPISTIGFDIAPDGTAYAAMTVMRDGRLYGINLASGAATDLGEIIDGDMTTISSIAVVPDTINAYGLTTSNKLIGINLAAPEKALSTVTVTGLQGGENLLGIDFRPATAQLYGLGSTSRIYTIEPATGVATQVGTGTLTTPLSGAEFGVDFNPLVDRIRVVSDAEQNLRLNPNNGAVASADPNLNPGDPNAVAAAYTNNFPGTTGTTLYDIGTPGTLYVQNPPNNGTMVPVGPTALTTGLTGFDIVAQTGTAFAALDTFDIAKTSSPDAPPSRLFTIDLTSGASTEIGSIAGGENLRGLATTIDYLASQAPTKPLVYRNNIWYFRLALSTGPNDLAVNYGLPGDIPVICDWNGDGLKTVAIYRNGVFYIKNTNASGNADLVVPYGLAGDKPICGDWNGDGIETIGVIRGTMWYLRNTSTPGPSDIAFTYGAQADMFVTGDWNGDGVDTPGAFRLGTWYLRNTNTNGNADVFFNYGLSTDWPLVGDWDNDGDDTAGVIRTGTWYLRDDNSPGFANNTFAYGLSGDLPLAWE